MEQTAAGSNAEQRRHAIAAGAAISGLADARIGAHGGQEHRAAREAWPGVAVAAVGLEDSAAGRRCRRCGRLERIEIRGQRQCQRAWRTEDTAVRGDDQGLDADGELSQTGAYGAVTVQVGLGADRPQIGDGDRLFRRRCDVDAPRAPVGVGVDQRAVIETLVAEARHQYAVAHISVAGAQVSDKPELPLL